MTPFQDKKKRRLTRKVREIVNGTSREQLPSFHPWHLMKRSLRVGIKSSFLLSFTKTRTLCKNAVQTGSELHEIAAVWISFQSNWPSLSVMLIPMLNIAEASNILMRKRDMTESLQAVWYWLEKQPMCVTFLQYIHYAQLANFLYAWNNWMTFCIFQTMQYTVRAHCENTLSHKCNAPKSIFRLAHKLQSPFLNNYLIFETFFIPNVIKKTK